MTRAAAQRGPTVVLVAHGTRNPHGVEIIARIAESVAARLGHVPVAFVDVLGPSPSEVLSDLDGPAIVVPAFLASGYHVRTDVPREIAESGHRHTTVARALGPDPVLAGILEDRLRDAGWQPGDAVVLAAAGSSDSRALADVEEAARLLSARLGAVVEVGYAATAEPRVTEVVAGVRARTGARVFIASYLLAEGLFQNRLRESGADGVADPIGVHPGLVDLVCRRASEAQRPGGPGAGSSRPGASRAGLLRSAAARPGRALVGRWSVRAR
ncbi:sirohydrochlorin chelatase [Hoyosella sp. G463]|uniref:Sirohydrochlorin chelatase n=1 Tax=Lolliginicoccus lacisalsi TaxID=2742202 RepID=A0A927JCF0_9ACTN|nr:sirohydrochlorin chelatase [Lolliginicoccus lacisalsi]MBD8506654.1 sirohydrochlorin chelatase [Lolliginicoccus lacisalsi]